MKKLLLFFILFFLAPIFLTSVLAIEYESYKLIDTKNNELYTNKKAHTDHIYHLATSQDGQLLASTSVDGKIKIWDIDTKECIQTFATQHKNLYSIAFGKTNKLETEPFKRTPHLLTIFGNNSIVLLATQTGKFLKNFKITTQNSCLPCLAHNDWIRSFVLNEECTLLAAGTNNGKIFIWNVETEELILQKNAHKEGITDLVFNPNNPEILASCSRSKNNKSSIKIWQLKDKKLSNIREVKTEYISTIAFRPYSPYSALLASNWGNMINLWNMKLDKHEEHTVTIKKQHDWINALQYSPDGTKLAAGSGDKSITVWQTDTCELLATLEGHADWISTLIFSQNNKLIFSGAHDGTIVVWQEKKATHFDSKFDEYLLHNNLTDTSYTYTNY